MLSRWLLEHLDEQEMTATVAHELAHIRHRDTLMMFWVHSLCPGGFCLPPLRRQIRQLTELVENRADKEGVLLTGNPLALASALTKVGKQLTLPHHAPVLPLTGNGNASLPCCWVRANRRPGLT
ncbi:MAG: M56 family metallopeptidase [Gammaproteobacteria bacterium]